MIGLDTGPISEIVAIAAHCDDLAIGMGATLLSLARAHPGLRVRALVLTGGGTAREIEEEKALAAFCPGATVELTVLDVPDGRLPAHWERVKQALADFRRDSDPQLVFATQRDDAHQDHRLLAELVPTEFRDHLILGYEILKWETDTPRPTVFHRVTNELAQEKARLLVEHYPSQTGHDWFDADAFLALSRLRGVHSRAAHAEAFVIEKATLTFGGH